MKSKYTALITRYGIPLLAGMVISYLVALYRGFAPDQPTYLMTRYWSDGFFVTGILLSGLGGLLVISATGFFDLLSYSIYFLLIQFIQAKSRQDYASFYTYKTRKDARRGKPKVFLLLVGLGFFLLSAGFWALHSLHT